MTRRSGDGAEFLDDRSNHGGGHAAVVVAAPGRAVPVGATHPGELEHVERVSAARPVEPFVFGGSRPLDQLASVGGGERTQRQALDEIGPAHGRLDRAVDLAGAKSERHQHRPPGRAPE